MCKKDTQNTLIYGNEDKVIAVMGLHDMIVVDTKDALLICPKGKAQQVKDLVALMEQDNLTKFM